MAKSLGVGPQTVSQSKFSSLKQKQKKHVHNLKFVRVHENEEKNLYCLSPKVCVIMHCCPQL